MPLWTDDDLEGLPPGRRRHDAWVALRTRELRSLAGQQLRDWQGVRMALREAGRDGDPQFDDPGVPLRQFDTLFLETSNAGWVQLLTDQDDYEFGLYARRVRGAPDIDLDGIFRPDHLVGLPRGKIDGVSLKMSALGNIDCIEFRVEGTEVILIAAEAYEDPSGELYFVRGDESLLLFTSREAVESVRWRGAE